MSLSGSALCTAASTASAAAWPCPTPASGETPITTSAKCCPAAWRIRSRRSCTLGPSCAIAARAASLRLGGNAVHEHVDVPVHEPPGGDQHEHRDEERGGRIPFQPARPGQQETRRARRSSPPCRSRNGARSRQAPGCRSGVRRAARPSSGSQSTAITTTTTTIAYHVGLTRRLGGADEHRQRAVRDVEAREHEDRGLRRARPGARPCRARTGCPRSAGRPATPTAKSVRSAATRSVPEWIASEIRPRLPVASPVPSFSAMSAQAAATETRAVRRCGLMPEGYGVRRRSVPAARGGTRRRRIRG